MITIEPLRPDDMPAVVELSLEAWTPVFEGVKRQLGTHIFEVIYPDWHQAQAEAVEDICSDGSHEVWVAVDDEQLVGFVGYRFTTEDAADVGEIVITAVDPDRQGEGVGRQLVAHAISKVEAEGVDLVVVATGGDPGHAPARRLYENMGFDAFPLARYYKRPTAL